MEPLLEVPRGLCDPSMSCRSLPEHRRFIALHLARGLIELPFAAEFVVARESAPVAL